MNHLYCMFVICVSLWCGLELKRTRQGRTIAGLVDYFFLASNKCRRHYCKIFSSFEFGIFQRYIRHGRTPHPQGSVSQAIDRLLVHNTRRRVPGYPATHNSVHDYSNSQSVAGVLVTHQVGNNSRAVSGFSSIGTSVRSCPGFVDDRACHEYVSCHSSADTRIVQLRCNTAHCH